MQTRAKVLIGVAALVVVFAVVITIVVVEYKKSTSSSVNSSSGTPVNNGTQPSNGTNPSSNSSPTQPESGGSPVKIFSCQGVSDTFGAYPGREDVSIITDKDAKTFWTANACQTFPQNVLTCQFVSDTFGAYPGHADGITANAAKTFWTDHACQTFPNDKLNCQFLSDTYNAYPGSTTGLVGPIAQQYFAANCKSMPAKVLDCQLISDTFNAYTGNTTNLSDPKVLDFWNKNACATVPSSTSCQSISNQFGAYPGNDVAITNPAMKQVWNANKCQTAPDSDDLLTCQFISDTYGAYPPANLGVAAGDTNITKRWLSQKCTTAKNIPDCQYISNNYNRYPGNNGTATEVANAVWDAKACNTIPDSFLTNCQKLSDIYNAYPGNNPPANSKAAAAFQNNKCSTAPGISSCQDASDKYNVYYNNWGTATPAVKAYWTANGCDTLPQSKALTCQFLSDTYGTYYGQWKNLTNPTLRKWWSTQNCATAPGIVQDASACQKISDQYGTVPGNFGSAPPEAQAFWSSNGCNTIPTSRFDCSYISQLYGSYPTKPEGVALQPAPAQVQKFFTDKGCTTAQSPYTCQYISDKWQVFNEAGKPVNLSNADAISQAFWPANKCTTSPVIQGRYVTFLRKGSGFITVRNIQVFTSLAKGSPNIATQKTVTMSSRNDSVNVESNATDQSWSSYAHTSDKDTTTFIKVDLGSVQTIAAIEIFNRVDCCTRRNNGCVIQVLKEDSSVAFESFSVADAQNSIVYQAANDIGTADLKVASWQCLPPNRTVNPILIGPSNNIDPMNRMTNGTSIVIPVLQVQDLQNSSGLAYLGSNVANLIDNNLTLDTTTWKTAYNFGDAGSVSQFTFTFPTAFDIWYVTYYYGNDTVHAPSSIEIYSGAQTSSGLRNSTAYYQKITYDANSRPAVSTANPVAWVTFGMNTPLAKCTQATLQIFSCSVYQNWPVEVQFFGYQS